MTTYFLVIRLVTFLFQTIFLVMSIVETNPIDKANDSIIFWILAMATFIMIGIDELANKLDAMKNE
jgi:hypothetical protein